MNQAYHRLPAGSKLRAAEQKTRSAILLFSIGEKLQGMSRKPTSRLGDARRNTIQHEISPQWRREEAQTKHGGAEQASRETVGKGGPRPSPQVRRLALHHPPRTCVVTAAPPGGRRRASRRLNSVRASVGGWGRLGASSWPQIRRWDRRRCCMADFWVTADCQKPVGCIRYDFLRSGCD
jgi:hypothetical protein